MPIYEYLCQACGHELEAIQKFSDVALTDCPVCAKSALKKQISAAGFQLKGKGWYATDFKDSGKKKEAKSEKKDSAKESSSDTSSGSSGDSKKGAKETQSSSACAARTCGCH